jgi:hypothetical protein
MTTHKEQRQHRYSWQTYTWVVMYMSVRNIDVVSVPCEWSCICLSGISMLSLFLVSGHVCVSGQTYMTTHKEQRLHRYSRQTYTWPLTRNRDNIDIPDTHIHVYVCHEYRCCFCSLWVVMYICVRNIDVVSVLCEWSCICLSGESMLSLTHKEQRQHRYSWHTYTWPRNKEQRVHRYSWQTYTWPLTKNRDYIDIPDTHIHNHTTRNRDNILCSLWVVMYICLSGISM